MNKTAVALVSVGALVAGAALAIPLAVVGNDDDDAPVRSQFVADDGVIVADHRTFDISDDRLRVSVTTSDPVVEACTEPVELAVEVLADVVVLRPLFRELPEGTLCEQACDSHTLSARLEKPLDRDLTVVPDPERLPIC